MTRQVAKDKEEASAVEYFGEQADRWQGLYALKPAFRDRLDLFVGSLLRLAPPPGRVLDFGCGPGVVSLALAAQGYEVLGVDGSQRMIDQAETQRARRGLTNAGFRLMPAEAFDVPEASVDAVVSSSVLQYVADDARLLAGFTSALKPGGWLLISVPHAGSVVGWLEAGLHRLPAVRRREGRGFLDHSRRLYAKRPFLAALERLGFGDFECTHFEVPVLGRWGIRLSRLSRVGVMLLVAGRKRPS
ncbi:MAG TPA: class I SAM-dependent methyltransferase [Vicinamibacteria bacterium]|nr:class I SAM-dependent methyltransferase [Vicinamibacteria bacterium]